MERWRNDGTQAKEGWNRMTKMFQERVPKIQLIHRVLQKKVTMKVRRMNDKRRIHLLLLLVEEKKLTIHKFDHFRSDIHRRVDNSKWTTDIILAPCLASVICILVLLFHADRKLIFLTTAWVVAMTKEFIFICIAFTYVAHVNAQADTLRTKLSKNVWLASAYLDASVNVADSVKGSELINEIQRLTMCVSCFAEPISFTLLFKRVSWANVFMAAAGFAITLVLGSIIRSQVSID